MQASPQEAPWELAPATSRRADHADASTPGWNLTLKKILSAADAVEREFRDSVVYRKAKRVVILLVGGTVLVAGVALLVLPGPASIVIPAGLSILAIEFAWARRWLRRARSIWEESKKRLTG